MNKKWGSRIVVSFSWNDLEIGQKKKSPFGAFAMAWLDGEGRVSKQTVAWEEVNWMGLSAPVQTRMSLLPAEKGIVA